MPFLEVSIRIRHRCHFSGGDTTVLVLPIQDEAEEQSALFSILFPPLVQCLLLSVLIASLAQLGAAFIS